MALNILHEFSFTTGELGHLLNCSKYLVFLFGLLLFNDDFVLVFTHYVTVISTLVEVALTESGRSFLQFVLSLDFILGANLFVLYNGELGNLNGIEHFFGKNFGLLLFVTLLLLFGLLFLFDSVVGKIHHSLLGEVLGTLFGLGKHSVDYKGKQECYCNDDYNNNHRLIVTSVRFLTELVCTKFFVFTFKDYIAPFF